MDNNIVSLRVTRDVLYYPLNARIIMSSTHFQNRPGFVAGVRDLYINWVSVNYFMQKKKLTRSLACINVYSLVLYCFD